MVLLPLASSSAAEKVIEFIHKDQPLTPYLHFQNLLTLSLKKGFQDSDGTHLYKRQNGLWCNSLSRLSYSNSKETEAESHFELLLGTWQSLWSFLKVSGFWLFMSWQKKFSWKVVANMNVALEVVNWFMALAILTGFGIEYYRAHHSTMCL